MYFSVSHSLLYNNNLYYTHGKIHYIWADNFFIITVNEYSHKQVEKVYSLVFSACYVTYKRFSLIRYTNSYDKLQTKQGVIANLIKFSFLNTKVSYVLESEGDPVIVGCWASSDSTTTPQYTKNTSRGMGNNIRTIVKVSVLNFSSERASKQGCKKIFHFLGPRSPPKKISASKPYA